MGNAKLVWAWFSTPNSPQSSIALTVTECASKGYTKTGGLGPTGPPTMSSRCQACLI